MKNTKRNKQNTHTIKQANPFEQHRNTQEHTNNATVFVFSDTIKYRRKHINNNNKTNHRQKRHKTSKSYKCIKHKQQARNTYNNVSNKKQTQQHKL